MAKLYLILCLVGYCLAQICTVTVPPKPLTAAGLATPYLVEGCNQGDPAATTFVHGAFINPATGAISVYNPLAINKGTLPAIAPRAPVLPNGAVVGIWFGSNSNVVALKTNGTSLTDGNCVNGGATPFGQFAYCNAPAFFAAANAAIAAGKLVVPPLGTAADGQPCPTVREYFVVDMDPSDNVNTAYLITAAGLLAQATAANKLALPGATVVVNPSDNRLISVAVDGALGCKPWTAPDVADNNTLVTALPLNELFAAANQAPPLALVPAGDPMVLENTQTNLAKLNAYRVGVNQPMANTLQDGDTATFCKFFYNIQPARLKLNQVLFTGQPSPAPTVANNLFTFLANRYLTAFGPAANGGLGCDTLLGVKNPVTVTMTNGIVTAAVITPPVIPNPNCNIIVPNNPLTAVGLSTPYQLVATKAANGPCNQANPNQASFVQGAIVDVDMGTISVYNPLVIDKGTQPAAAPVVPTLPPNNVVGLWFGSNANVLTLVGAGGAATLTGANCVNGGLNAGLFGQYSYCNAVAFYKAANFVINRGQLTVPPLGTAADGQPCPTTRDFFVVDMDPSDNVVTSYLVTAAGTTAQDTAANRAALTGATVAVNPSDERLVSVAIDGALQCTPWKVPDLANPGSMVPALPVNELFAARNQKFPQARVPENDPMVVDGNGNANLGKLNAYRAGVNQFAVQALGVANTTRFCNRFGNIAPNRLMAAQSFLANAASPDPNAASNLFNFLCNRFNTAYGAGGLNCVGLLNVQTPITTTQDQNAVVVSCTINLALVPTLDLTPDVDGAVSDLGDTNVKPPNPSLLPTIVQPTILLGGSSLVTPLVVLILSVILLLL